MAAAAAAAGARLRDDDVRRREEHRERRDDREQGEYDKAQSVDHHRRELPVARHVGGLVLLPQLVGDEADLLQDEGQLVVGAEAGVVGDERFVQSSTAIAVVLVLPVDCSE